MMRRRIQSKFLISNWDYFFHSRNLYLYSPYKWTALFVFGIGALEAIFDSILKVSIKVVVDKAIIPQNHHLLVLILLLLGGGAIVLILLSVLGDYLNTKFTIAVLNDIR